MKKIELYEGRFTGNWNVPPLMIAIVATLDDAELRAEYDEYADDAREYGEYPVSYLEYVDERETDDAPHTICFVEDRRPVESRPMIVGYDGEDISDEYNINSVFEEIRECAEAALFKRTAGEDDAYPLEDPYPIVSADYDSAETFLAECGIDIDKMSDDEIEASGLMDMPAKWEASLVETWCEDVE